VRGYLERVRWHGTFECQHCHEKGEPYRFAGRPGVLRCRKCKRDTSLMRGTVMQDTHSPLTTWFWGAYLVSTMTPGISAVQFQRQLGLTRYETAFQILHKLRAGMVRQVATGSAAISRAGITSRLTKRTSAARYMAKDRVRKIKRLCVPPSRFAPARLRKAISRCAGVAATLADCGWKLLPNRGAKALCDFVERAVEPGAMVITDAWRAYNGLTALGYDHLPVVEGGTPQVAEEFLPIVHLVFSNLKAWLQGTHHGRVEPKHLQTYLNEFTFRFNRRFYPFNAFRFAFGHRDKRRRPHIRRAVFGRVEAPHDG